MKKTFSLKLMLLGLLIGFGSIATYAADFFANGALVYQKLGGTSVSVVGVTGIPNTGILTIPTSVTDTSDPNNGTCFITKIDNDWYLNGDLKFQKAGHNELVGKTKNLLTEVNPFKLVIDARDLTKIDTEALQPLNKKISGFEVTANAGLIAIPDYAFANIPWKNNGNAVDANKVKELQNKIKALEELSKYGVADRTGVPIIGEDGLVNAAGDKVTFGDGANSKTGIIIDQDFVGKKVFVRLHDLTTSQNLALIAGYISWIIIDETKKDPNNENAFAAYVLTADGQISDKGEFVEWGTGDAYDEPYLVKNFGGTPGWLVVGAPITTKPSTQTVTVLGLETKMQMAEAAYMKLLQGKNNFDAMADAVEADPTKAANYTTDPLKTAAQVKKALDAAKKARDNAKAAWDQGQLVVGENFWKGGNVSYIITNAVREIAPEMTKEQILAKQFSTAKDPEATTKRALYDELSAAEIAAGETMSEVDRVMRIVKAMADAGYLQNTKGGYDKPSFQELQEAMIDTQRAYDAALAMWNDVIAYNAAPYNVPATKKNDKNEDVAIKEITVSGDAGPKYGENQATGITYAQLLAALNEALLAKNEATETYNAVLNSEATLEDLNGQLTDAENGTATADVLDYDNIKTNTTLKNVNIESAKSLNTIGKYAFIKCQDAVLNGTAAKLPLTLTTIKEHAFDGAAKANPVFTTLTNLAAIEKYAFAYSGATNGDFSGATKLEKFETNVFDNCKLTNLLLKGTPLKAIPGKLAYAGMIDTDQDGKVDYTEGVYLENAKFVDACGYFHNYDVTKAEDVAALKALGFKDTEIKAVNVAGSLNGGEAWVNTTLTETSLPEAITVVPDQAYYNCINLAALTGGVPAGVTEIGDYAFYRTKITVFDLSKLDKLTEIGIGAFGGNSELTKVTLPTKAAEGVAGLTSLPADVFECDSKLGEITLNPEISCLAPGLFANTSIKKLDLSNTQVTVLPDLFMNTEITNPEAQTRWKAKMAENPNSVFNTLTTITLPETVLKETTTQNWAAGDAEIPGLQIIGNRAFEQLQGITKMTIPSSVWAMGEEVFAYCKNLKTVTAMDSRLTNLGNKTFRNCSNLTSVTFVTLAVIDPAWKLVAPGGKWHTSCGDVAIGGLYNFDDTQFFNCPKIPTITVTPESYEIIKGQFFKSYAEEYSKLKKFQATITLTDNGTNFSDTYYNEFYGTWIKCDEADVYTAYQNVNEMILYKAKRHNNYYKIPALNQKPIVMSNAIGNGRPYGELNPGTQIIPGVLPESESTTPWVSKGENQKNVFWYTGYDSPVSIPEGSPAVIIIAKKAKINVERHSLPGEKFQSTLDCDNELRIAGTTINTDNTSNLCVWATDYETQHTFYILNDTEYIIPKGKVLFPLGAWQGTANGRLNITIIDDELTGIMGVKDYLKNVKNSDAIYNLQGVRVSATQKGQMYIQGGKKFIQK